MLTQHVTQEEWEDNKKHSPTFDTGSTEKEKSQILLLFQNYLHTYRFIIYILLPFPES